MCSAGYSRELRQMLRIYPLPIRNGMHQWSIYSIDLERNAQDSRFESWALKGRSLESAGVTGNVRRYAERDFLESLVSPSIAFLNENRRSLGLIRPGQLSGHYARRESTNDPRQGVLFEYCDKRFGASAIDVIPMLRFSDADGEHDLQVRELGAYEFLRKNRGSATSLWRNYRLTDSDYDHLLFVGNMNCFRNSWLIINVLPFKRKHAERSLFDDAATTL